MQLTGICEGIVLRRHTQQLLTILRTKIIIKNFQKQIGEFVLVTLSILPTDANVRGTSFPRNTHEHLHMLSTSTKKVLIHISSMQPKKTRTTFHRLTSDLNIFWGKQLILFFTKETFLVWRLSNNISQTDFKP